MKKFICLLIVILLFYSCQKKEISNLPFEVNKNISCDDLYNAGYKRTFGVDVIMLGKIMDDIIIHYQVDISSLENDKYDLEENNSIEIDTLSEKKNYDKYLEVDALTLSDSTYRLVWGSIKKQKKNICNNGSVSWRNFILELKKTEAKNYRNTIDTAKYKILNVEIDSMYNYNIDDFKVVNLISKDTFYCSVYEQNKKYYFSSTFTLINYE